MIPVLAFWMGVEITINVHCVQLHIWNEARAALLTGRLPIRNGFYSENAHARDGNTV